MGVVKYVGMWLLFLAYLFFVSMRLVCTLPFSALAYLGYILWLSYAVSRVEKSSNTSIAQTFKLNYTKRFRNFLIW